MLYTRDFLIKSREITIPIIQNALKSLGLNEKEMSQFIEYWEPRMQGFGLNKISFMNTKELQQTIPLFISPKPDTLIRILMKFEGLNSGQENIQPFTSPLSRNGFTVVEWGGVS